MSIMGKPIIQTVMSPVMLMLVAASITAVALVLERFWYFLRNRVDANRSLLELRRLLTSSGPAQALSWARSLKNPVGRMFTHALENAALNTDELSDLLYSLILDERVRFERRLGGMGTLANAATLLGLLGTVTGLITAFNNIRVTGQAGPDVIAGGIAEALLTTAFGLLIGIPTLFFYNYFSKKASDIATTMESTSDRLVVLLSRTKAQFEGFSPATPTAQPAPQPRPAVAEDTTWKF
ncbi:MotA/TolQ/ExbB proton channel family protein [candidate division WOR-3 bacterium]|nr:MotA/TolQ/ExbB proton channel family protein [candidate division WOR-3 bacterium]